MISWAVIFVLGRLGFTAVEATTLAPTVITFLKTGYSIYQALVTSGIDPGAALVKVISMIGAPHKMTPAEEKLWMDHASNVGAGGG